MSERPSIRFEVHRQVRAAGYAWAIGMAGAVLPASFAYAAPATHTVVIEGMAFQPAVIEVKAGDTIVWQNKDVVPHTVTAKGQHIESGEIGMGKSWRYRAKKPGTIHYICRYHPMMQGQVVVTK
jgi:plastocyanin